MSATLLELFVVVLGLLAWMMLVDGEEEGKWGGRWVRCPQSPQFCALRCMLAPCDFLLFLAAIEFSEWWSLWISARQPLKGAGRGVRPGSFAFEGNCILLFDSLFDWGWKGMSLKILE